MDMNTVTIMGNLTQAPETRSVSDNQCTNIRVASNRIYTARDGGRREETCYVDVSCWGRLGETCAQSLRKGSNVLIEGRLRLGQWRDRDSGQNRSRPVIVADYVHFLTPKAEADISLSPPAPTPAQYYSAPPPVLALSGAPGAPEAPAQIPPVAPPPAAQMPSAPPKPQPTPAAPPASAAPPPPPCALPAPAPAPVPASPPALPEQQGGE